MTPKTICIDIDNTIADYTSALRTYCQETYRDKYPCPDPIAYDFSETPGWPFAGDTRRFHYTHKCAVGDRLYLKEEPYPLATEAIRILHNQGWRIIISTARHDDPGKQTERWLRQHRIPFDGLHYGGKLDIRADVLIDDNPRTLLGAQDIPGLLILHPNHEYCRSMPGITFTSWASIPDLIAETRR